MKIESQKSKPSKNARFNKLMLISVLMLTVLWLVIGCTNQITKEKTIEPPRTQRLSLPTDIYWFVESYDEDHLRTDSMDMLLQYLKEQGDNLCIEALEQFINEFIGLIEIIVDQEEAEAYEKTLGEKETIVIKLPNGSTLHIVKYK